MAGRSGYVIELSGEERAELERRVACCTLPHRVVRGKMILYAAEGQSTAEIARRLETASRVVNRWRKRFFEVRLAGLEDRERAGTARAVFPLEQVAELKALAFRAAGDLRPFLSAVSRVLSCTGWWSSAASARPPPRRSGAGCTTTP
jgi:Winged helix-turn helix